MFPLKNLIRRFLSFFITKSEGPSEISESREITTHEDRETTRPITDSFSCPSCQSQNFVRRGLRIKKRESVQLYICKDCGKTFTPHAIRGKHYPLATIFDAISLYNLGHSLEEACRRVNLNTKKSAFKADLVRPTDSLIDWPDNLKKNITPTEKFVKSQISQISKGVDLPRVEPGRLGLSDQSSKPAKPTPESVSHVSLQPSTLSAWLSEFKDNLPFLRMRDFATGKYKPEAMVETATLAHRQLYRFRFHRAKCALVMQENFHHRIFTPLVEFLEMVPGECPHQ